MLIVFILVIVGLIVLFEIGFDMDGAGYFMSIVISLIFCLIWIVAYTSSMSESAELVAFYNSNHMLYDASISETKDATLNLEPQVGILADLPHMQEGIEIAKRVQEKRDEFVKYNITLQKRRIYDRHRIFGVLFYDTDLTLEPIGG